MQPRRILCATDMSEAADEAIRRAAALGKDFGAAVRVFHALPLLRHYPLFPHTASEEAVDLPALQKEALDLLAARSARVGGRDDMELEVEAGEPDAAIIDAAERWGAELVVIGSHGTTGLKRLLLGSVAERVARHAHCPVLVARPAPVRPPGVPPTIVAATDLSCPSLPAITAAREMGERQGASTVVLHCVEVPVPVVGIEGGLAVPMPPMPETRAAVIEGARERIQESIAKLGISGVEVRISEEPPLNAIVRLAEEIPAEMVVVGTHGRTGLRRALLGSVAESVVRYAPCSVLVVRLPPRE